MNQPRKKKLPEPMETLKSIPLFSCLNDAEIASLEASTMIRTFPKETLLICEGDHTTSLYVIIDGSAMAVSIDAEGKQIIHNIFRPGDFFGEMSFLDDEPRCASVISRTLTTVLIVQSEGFRQLIVSKPEIVLRLFKELLQKLRNATQKIEDLVFLDAYGRVSRFLIQSSRQMGEKRVIKEKLSQQDIADHVGSSREMVSRILKDLIAGGYLTRHRKIISIEKDLPYSF